VILGRCRICFKTVLLFTFTIIRYGDTMMMTVMMITRMRISCCILEFRTISLGSCFSLAEESVVVRREVEA